MCSFHWMESLNVDAQKKKKQSNLKTQSQRKYPNQPSKHTTCNVSINLYLCGANSQLKLSRDTWHSNWGRSGTCSLIHMRDVKQLWNPSPWPLNILDSQRRTYIGSVGKQSNDHWFIGQPVVLKLGTAGIKRVPLTYSSSYYNWQSVISLFL